MVEPNKCPHSGLPPHCFASSHLLVQTGAQLGRDELALGVLVAVFLMVERFVSSWFLIDLFLLGLEARKVPVEHPAEVWLFLFLSGFLLRFLREQLEAIGQLWICCFRTRTKSARRSKAASFCSSLEALWCLSFMAFLAVEGDCYGDLVVSGALGPRRFVNGDYSKAEEQHNGKPVFVKTSGQGTIYFWEGSGQWRLINASLSEAVNWSYDTRYQPSGISAPPAHSVWRLHMPEKRTCDVP